MAEAEGKMSYGGSMRESFLLKWCKIERYIAVGLINKDISR